MLTLLNREGRGAPPDSSAEEMAGRLLMNYADGTKHEAGEEIRTKSNLANEKSDTQKVVDDVAGDGIFQSVTCEESGKDKDKLSKGCQATERVENKQKGGKGALDSGGESVRNEKEKHALGFYRVLRNPVKINGDGNTKEEMNNVNNEEDKISDIDDDWTNNEGEEEEAKNGTSSGDKGEDKSTQLSDNDDDKISDIIEQCDDDWTNDNQEEKNVTSSGDKEEDNNSQSDKSDAPIAIDEDLTTYTEVSSSDLTDDNQEPTDREEGNPPDVKSDGISLMETTKLANASKTESSDLFQMEKELKVVEVKFKELAREIELLEKHIEAGAGEIENLEFELTKVEAECDKKLQYKEDLEKHLREDRLEEKKEITMKVTSENVNIEKSISCIEDSSKEEITADDADNEEMENGETPKTEEETFFSFTPSEVSEDEKTFSVKLETTDVATETVDEDEILAKVEENHSDLLLNCLVRYQPWCLPFSGFVSAKTLLMSFSLYSDTGYIMTHIVPWTQLLTETCGVLESS